MGSPDNWSRNRHENIIKSVTFQAAATSWREFGLAGAQQEQRRRCYACRAADTGLNNAMFWLDFKGPMLWHRCVAEIRSEWRTLLAQVVRDRKLVLLLFLIQLTAYSYLFTTISFSNHLFPNAFLNPYPSFRTTSQGRWLLDLIIFLQGGNGVQSVQLVFATALQACNALIFLRLLEIKRAIDLIILGTIFCLYPHFLDYYSFASDHIAFVIGDSLALLGLVFLYRCRGMSARLVAASTCWFLSLSSYAPKLGLICLLIVIMPLLCLLNVDLPNTPDINTKAGNPKGIRWLSADFAQGLAALLVAVLAFWVSTRFTITAPWPEQTNLNNPAEALEQLKLSYRHWQDIVDNVVGGLTSPRFSLVPALTACALLFLRAAKQGWKIAIFTCFLLLMIPVSLQSTWIVNNQAWQSSGRLLTAYAYLMVFYLGVAIRSRRLRQIATVASAFLAWFSFIFATQATNAIQIKTAYNLGIINRIVSRIEPLIESRKNDSTPIVIFGEYPKFNTGDYIKSRSVDRSELVDGTPFVAYRHVDILNQVLGRRLFRPPTSAEVAQARQAASKVQAWPAPDSVFRNGNIIVVVLEPGRLGGPFTGQPSEGTSGKPGDLP